MSILKLISISILIGLLFNFTPFSNILFKKSKKFYIFCRVIIFILSLTFLQAFYFSFFSNFDNLYLNQLRNHKLTEEKALYIFLLSHFIFAYFFRIIFSSLFVPKRARLYLDNLRIFIIILALSINFISELFPYAFSENYSSLVQITNKVLASIILIDLLLVTLFNKYRNKIISFLHKIKTYYLRDTILLLAPFIVIWICTLINILIT